MELLIHSELSYTKKMIEMKKIIEMIEMIEMKMKNYWNAYLRMVKL